MLVKSTKCRDDLVANTRLNLIHLSQDRSIAITQQPNTHIYTTVEVVRLGKINRAETDRHEGTLELSNMIVHLVLVP